MTNGNSGDRLDRIEAALLQLIQQSADTDKQIKSNAKAIEALTSKQAEEERRAALDRARLYETMARVADAQASFYSAQADVYRRLENQDELLQTLSRRQGEIVAILKAVTSEGES